MANQVVYGFHNLADVFGQRVTEQGEGVVATAIAAAVAEHNRQIDAMLALFVRDVAEFKLNYRAPGVTRNQPLDEHGRPLPVKAAAKYEVAFPLQMSGNAIGWTWVAFQKLTVGEVNDQVRTVLMGDMRWVFDHILAALFTNVTWPFTDDEHGALTIQPLANGDATTYQLISGNDQVATDNHFLAQAGAIADAANPFPAIYTEITEHPENGGDTGNVITFVPTNVKAAVLGLATFHPLADPNIQTGANSDVLTGTLGTTVPGRLIGYEDSRVWIVEYPRMPNDYLITVSTAGDRPLGRRQDPEANLRGFVEIPQDDDATPFPYLRRTWIRRAGLGALNRVGAVVQRVGNGTYAIPTNFTSPMA